MNARNKDEERDQLLNTPVVQYFELKRPPFPQVLDSSDVLELPHVLDIESMSEFAFQNGMSYAVIGAVGCGKSSALRHACVGSGSPRETKLSLRLGLKPARGGYGMDVLSMNEPLEVRRIHNRMRAGVRKPDILLRAPAQATRNGRPLLGAAVEYDGKDHASEEAHARDAERHNELTAIGLVEYIVTKRQYRDLSYMDGLVDLIRRDLGIPAKRRTRAEAARLRRLRQRLYEELERIDGVHWDGRERRRAGQDGSRHDGWDVVPVEAYGLG